MSDLGNRFHPGDRVVDREADPDEGGRAVVLSYLYDVDLALKPARDVFIDALDGRSVAEVNPDYDPDGPVVRVAFVGYLDVHVGDRWRAWDACELYHRLETFADEWGFALQTYDYPAERLDPAEPRDWP